MGPPEDRYPVQSVRLELADASLSGELTIPEDCRGIVLFVPCTDRGRHCPRNRTVAGELNQGGFGTLLVDLLAGDEERVAFITPELRFNIPLLTDRLTRVIDWFCSQPGSPASGIGLFGASTGAAAAIGAAAERPDHVRAVVSRGGRPILAGPALAKVKAPTLFLAAEFDTKVIELNDWARSRMTAETRLEIVPGASPLFEEPGSLTHVAQLARNWFATHLLNHRFVPA